MKKVISIITILQFFLFLNASPFKIIEENHDFIRLEFDLPEYQLSEDNGFTLIHIPGSSKLLEEGLPEIPFFSDLICLPEGGDFQISLLEKQIETLNNVNISPVSKTIFVEGMPIETPYQNSSFYSKSILYPTVNFEKGETAYYRDNYFTSFRFYPIKCNPQTKEVQIITKAKIQINFTGDDKGEILSFNPIRKNKRELFLNSSHSEIWKLPRKHLNYHESLRATNEVDAIQIIVDEEGIYKIDYKFLMDALNDYSEEEEIDIDWSINWDQLDPRQLELSDEHGAVPIYFFGEADGSFDSGDYFEFYGSMHKGDECYYDDYTSENVYSLKLVENTGSRMAVENGGIQEIDPVQYIAPFAFQETIHLEKQIEQNFLGAQFVHESADYYREDVYFWDKISAPNLSLYSFDLQYPYRSNIKRFTAKALLFGLTFNPENYDAINHQAIVRINSSIINNSEWAGQREQLIESIEPISNNTLLNGANTLYISLPGIDDAPNEQVLLDWVELTYWREYKTDNDYLKFSKPPDSPEGLHNFTLQNFSNEEVFVYKIGASIMENIQVGSIEMEPPFEVEFQDVVVSNDQKYIALTEVMKKRPKLIRPDFSSNLKNSLNEAEYLIITGEKFKEKEGTLQLQQIWENQNVATEIVSVQDIYDEFNHGIESVEAIRDFIAYVYDYWSGDRLEYVLLLGDGIMDEKDNSVGRKYNILPFRRVWVDARGAIASDNWMACIVGDDPVSDVSISRINVWEEDQILDVAEKIQSYIENPNYGDFWHSRLTFSAGGNPSEGTYFAKQSERIIQTYVPEYLTADRIYCNTTGPDIADSYQGNTTSLISKINDGTLYLQFMGHGGGRVWADYNLLNQADINTFNNGNYPFVASLSCYGSAFHYAQSSCIGEELILTPGKGAIAHIGFTGYGYKLADEIYAGYLNEAMFMAQKETIGDVINYTKARFFGDYGSGAIGTALIQGSALLGEARVNLILPEIEDDISLNGNTFSISDTLKMTANVDADITQGKFIIFDENDTQISLNDYYPFTLPVIDQTISASDFVIPASDDDIYSRTIRLHTSGESRETVSLAEFAIGQTAMADLEIIPASPTYEDSVMIKADFFDDDGIVSVSCRITNETEISMELVGGNSYELSQKITPHSPGSDIEFTFVIENNNGDITTTKSHSIFIGGIDLFLRSADVIFENGFPAVRVEIENIGLLDSRSFSVELRDILDDIQLLNSTEFDPILAGDRIVGNIDLTLIQGNVELQIILNPNSESFPEYNTFNNWINMPETAYNFGILDQHEEEIISLDGNLICNFPPEIVEEETVIYLNTLDWLEPVNQEDVNKIKLLNGYDSPAYRIGVGNTVLDSLSHLPAGSEIEMKFKLFENSKVFHQSIGSDKPVKSRENENLKVYRWEPDYDKWVVVGGQYYPNSNEVIFNTDRLGIFTLLNNTDVIEPDIDVNVEGQEFTYGGYISSQGTISFLLSDANGIDIFNEQIKIWLDGELIPDDEITISPTYGNLTNLPIKYQLDIDKGDHSLSIDCTDVNGVYYTRDINFKVNDEFDLINVANYPNPVQTKTIDIINSGRTRFTYVLTDDADEVYLKVYTVNGRRVKTFKGLPASVGYHEYPRSKYGWDCSDSNGFDLANGVYFYRLTAVKGSKKIEKINKLAILK